jgi:NADPH:quinone reductase
MGADCVVNHHKDLKPQIKELVGIDYTEYILCLNDTDSHFESMKQLAAPQGKICSIVETKAPIDLGGILWQKSATFVWELMFTRSLFQIPDMIAQHHLLNTVADLIDSKIIKNTLTEGLSLINAEICVRHIGSWNLVQLLERSFYLVFKLSLLSNHEVPNLPCQHDNNFFSINTSAL